MCKPKDNNRERVTGSTSTNQVEVDNIRTVTGRKAFRFRGPNYWNKLDNDSRALENQTEFKNHISKVVCRDVNHPG